MSRNFTDGCWYAVVPPQTTAPVEYNNLLRLHWNHLTTLFGKTNQTHELKAGIVQPLDITIKVDMDPDPDHVYKVGDTYPYMGFDKKGIVFEVDESGTSGKIFSLNYQYGLWWSTENVETRANDEDNGRVNMEIIRQRDNEFSKYPAFKWVHEQNLPGTTYLGYSTGIWYLPGFMEMSDFYNNKSDVAKAAATLKALNLNDHILFEADDHVAWNSTEWDYNPEPRAHCFASDIGMQSNTDKDDPTLFTWPIMAF